MATEKVHLSHEKATLLPTLYGRALDSRAAEPILADAYASDVVDRLDFDFAKTKMNANRAASVALRAKFLDDWTAEFLAAHDDAVVLHLGCGLDSRAYRMDPGPDMQWFDVDQPDVIELREKVYPAWPNAASYTMIGTSIGSSESDLEWLSRIPADRPGLVVGEGFFMYLKQDDGERLITRLTSHLPSGELIFDGLSRFGVRLQKTNQPLQATGAVVHWGVDDPRDLERLHPGLRCVDMLSAFDIPGFDRLGSGMRIMIRVLGSIPAMRRAARFLRYRW